MSTRRALENEEENHNKRQRLMEGVGDAPTGACFDSLNNDCLVNSFSFLPTDDLNTVVMCSQRCCEARDNESLDQTRTATIICSAAKHSTVGSFYETLGDASNTLTPNYTKLRICGLEKLENDWFLKTSRINRLVHVTTLELVLHPSEPNKSTYMPQSAITRLPEVFPNVTCLVLDGVNILRRNILATFFTSLRHLERLSWKGGKFNGYGFAMFDVKELSLDGCELESMGNTSDAALRTLSSEDQRFSDFYLLTGCKGLERLTIKDTTWSVSGDPSNTHVISQKMIMKLARNRPTLRWLKSDLTPENVAILRQERPDVTFVPN